MLIFHRISVIGRKRVGRIGGSSRPGRRGRRGRRDGVVVVGIGKSIGRRGLFAKSVHVNGAFVASHDDVVGIARECNAINGGRGSASSKLSYLRPCDLENKTRHTPNKTATRKKHLTVSKILMSVPLSLEVANSVPSRLSTSCVSSPVCAGMT